MCTYYEKKTQLLQWGRTLVYSSRFLFIWDDPIHFQSFPWIKQSFRPYWLVRKYESHPDLVSLRPEPIETDMANRDKESYKEENAALKKRIKELEKALAFSKLETEARDIMIEKAESYFNIPIRKKSGAKQWRNW